MKLCPHCNAVQLSSAVVCSKCGKDMNAAPEPEVQEEPQPQEAQEDTSDTQPETSEESQPDATDEAQPEATDEAQPEATDEVQPEDNAEPTEGTGSVYSAEDESDSVSIYEADVEEEDTGSGIYELSEEDQARRQELMEEMEDLRGEGYNVSRLEKALDGDVSEMMDHFNAFMDDIDALIFLKDEFEELDTEGFEQEAESISSRLKDPDAVQDLTAEVGFLKTKISERGIAEKLVTDCDTPEQESEEEVVVPRVVKVAGEGAEDEPAAAGTGGGIFGVLMKLTNARSAFGAKDYTKAKQLYAEVLSSDPNNEEAAYYLEKIGRLERGEEDPAPGPSVQPIKDAPPTTGSVPVYEEPLPVESTPYRGEGEKAPEPDDPCDAAMSDADKQRTLAKYDALAFKAYINRDWELAIQYYDKLLSVDPEFKNAEKRKKECQEKKAAASAPVKVKKKKKIKKVKRAAR